MSDAASTAGASEDNPTAADAVTEGSSAEGAATGTQATADSSAGGSESWEARARSWQSRADQAEARARAAEAEAARLKESGSSSSAPPAPGLTLADLQRVRELDRASEKLKVSHPDADPILFEADPLGFESVEAYRLAVTQSHEARKASREEMERQADERIRARYAEKYGPLGDEAAPPGGEAVGGIPTPGQIAAMSLSEQIAFEAANPGVIDQVLAKHSTDALIGSKIGGNSN